MKDYRPKDQGKNIKEGMQDLVEACLYWRVCSKYKFISEDFLQDLEAFPENSKSASVNSRL